MKTDTTQRIIDYVTEHREVTAKELRDFLGLGAPALFRQLKKLIEQGQLIKTGQPPKVFYYLAPPKKPEVQELHLDAPTQKKLEDNFLVIPQAVDQVIRKKAKQQGKSFNQTVVDLLSLQVFGSLNPKEDPHFDWLFNQSTLDTGFDVAISELSQVDEALWQ